MKQPGKKHGIWCVKRSEGEKIVENVTGKINSICRDLPANKNTDIFGKFQEPSPKNQIYDRTTTKS